MSISDDEIPLRHKHMFSLRKQGYMQQAKFPYYKSKEWIFEHPTSLVPDLQVDRNSILYRLEEFLISQNKYHCVQNELYRNWLINDKEFYVIFDEHDIPHGRAITWKEADAICDKYPLYQWDIKKDKRFASLPILTISDVYS